MEIVFWICVGIVSLAVIWTARGFIEPRPWNRNFLGYRVSVKTYCDIMGVLTVLAVVAVIVGLFVGLAAFGPTDRLEVDRRLHRLLVQVAKEKAPEQSPGPR